MHRAPRVLTTAVLLAGSVCGALLSAHSVPADSRKTVFVSAIDASANPIVGAPKEDWGVREDGTNREIIDVKPATDPLEVAILVDTTKQVQPSVGDLRNAVGAFVKILRSGKSDVNVSLNGFGGSGSIMSDFGRPQSDLDNAVKRIFPGPDSASALLDTLIDVAKRVGKRPSPRRVILSINQEGAAENGNIAPQAVIDAVVPTTASFWALSYRVPGSEGNAVTSRQVVLDNLPPATGGLHININASAALLANVTRIAQVLVAQYAVTYSRPDGPAPKKLEMAVARPGAQMLVPRTPPQ